MRNIRMVTGGVIVPAVLLAMGMTVGGALAQIASNETAGKRVLLLQIIEKSRSAKPTTAKPVTKGTLASRSRIKRHARLAGKNRPAPTQFAQPPAYAEVRSPADATAARPTPQPPAPPGGPQLGEVGGDAMTVASSGEVHESDLPSSNALPTSGAPPESVAESNHPDIANAAWRTDFADVAVARQRSGDVGSRSWILQLLATLGGAVTAGSVAWFLIGEAPRRSLG